jgi:imidazolonepropionase-like amidohydrolase
MNFTTVRREERILGTAAQYVAAGVPSFSLNTDAPVVPQEQLFLQGSMSARLGADAYTMLRALTANPADAILLGDRVGSIERGKDADIVISSGDPLDPRSRVEIVIIDGEVNYSREADGQLY